MTRNVNGVCRSNNGQLGEGCVYWEERKCGGEGEEGRASFTPTRRTSCLPAGEGPVQRKGEHKSWLLLSHPAPPASQGNTVNTSTRTSIHVYTQTHIEHKQGQIHNQSMCVQHTIHISMHTQTHTSKSNVPWSTNTTVMTVVSGHCFLNDHILTLVHAGL